MNDFINFPSNIDNSIGAKAPSATVIIAKGIEWDNEYIHVRDYASVQALVNHVQAKAVWSSTACAPVKEGKYTFRPNDNSADISECNYIAFKNSPYTQDWSFGFITNVTWLSANDCEVTWEYDVFQMCWYSANIKPCFVERHHISSTEDEIGANVVPDDLETGPMYCYKHNYNDWGDMYIGVYLSEMPRGQVPPGTARLYNGVYSGLISYVVPSSDYDSVTQLLDAYDEGNQDAVQLIYMFPEICLNTEDYPNTVTESFNVKTDYGYTPKNKKLFTYPYSYCIIDDNNGNCFEMKPELTVNGVYMIKSAGVRNTMPAVSTWPMNYGGVQENHNYGFTTTGFPLCAWITDTFKAWLAQNRNSLALGAISSGMNTISGGVNGLVQGGPVGAVTGLVSGGMQIARTMATVLDKQVVPNQAKGNVNSDSVNVALGLCRVDMYGMRPSLEMCKCLDDYWTAFGYPIHQITTPNVDNRPYWNYVKTVDCGFTSNADLDLLKQFRNIFNKGVTIWHTDDIGNYNLNNA